MPLRPSIPSIPEPVPNFAIPKIEQGMTFNTPLNKRSSFGVNAPIFKPEPLPRPAVAPIPKPVERIEEKVVFSVPEPQPAMIPVAPIPTPPPRPIMTAPVVEEQAVSVSGPAFA